MKNSIRCCFLLSFRCFHAMSTNMHLIFTLFFQTSSEWTLVLLMTDNCWFSANPYQNFHQPFDSTKTDFLRAYRCVLRNERFSKKTWIWVLIYDISLNENFDIFRFIFLFCITPLNLFLIESSVFYDVKIYHSWHLNENVEVDFWFITYV